jgi:hypothetical protein
VVDEPRLISLASSDPIPNFRALVLAAVLLVPFVAHAKGRAVGPGAGDCAFGVIVRPGFVSWIAIDATDVYYFDENDSTVYRVSQRGGVRTPLALVEGYVVVDLIVDEANVYLAAFPQESRMPIGSILKVSKTGSGYSTFVSSINFPYELRADSTHVYWTALGTTNFGDETVQSDGKVERARKDGSGRQTLAANLSAPSSLVLDPDTVYFAERGVAEGNASQGVSKVAKIGGPILRIDDHYAAFELADAGSSIVYYGGVASSNRSGVLRVAKTGGTSEWLVEDPAVVGGPRVIADQVYFIDALLDVDSVLMRVPLSGGAPQFVTGAPLSGSDFEVDLCGLYYPTYEGAIVHAPR